MPHAGEGAGPQKTASAYNRKTTNNAVSASRQGPKQIVTLSAEQQHALNRIDEFLDDKKRQVFRFSGFGGVGKSTLAARIPELWDGPTQFVAYAAKAAARLRELGYPGARTIHSTIFDPPDVDVLPPDYEWQLKTTDKLPSHRTLIIADEVSMIGTKLGSE